MSFLENNIFLVSLYVLCFVYLYAINSEYPSMILLTLLNFVYLFFYFPRISKESSIKAFVVYPLKISIRVIIIVSWLLLMVANIWLINHHSALRVQNFKKKQRSNLGKVKNTDKTNLKIVITCGTLSILMLHLLSDNGDLESMLPPFLSSKINMAKIGLSIVGLALSLTSAQLSSELSSSILTGE
jgi:hypothetical protein